MLCTCRSWSVGRQVVEQQDGAVAAGEELLQREDLPPVAQRVAGEQPQLRERVEHDARRLERARRPAGSAWSWSPARPRTGGTSCTARRARACPRAAATRGRSTPSSPAVRRGDRAQLLVGLGQRDVEHGLARVRALEQELQRQRGLAGARHALDQVEPVARQAAHQNVVETHDYRCWQTLPGRCWLAAFPSRGISILNFAPLGHTYPTLCLSGTQAQPPQVLSKWACKSFTANS